jgi:hypothetical protein
MKKMWLVIALFLGFSGAAHAGVMIEPYLGYEMGTTSGSSPGKTTCTTFAYTACCACNKSNFIHIFDTLNYTLNFELYD